MDNLVACRIVRFYGISKNPGKSKKFKLVPFENDVFNEDFDESDLDVILTDLVNDLYGQENGCHWFEIEEDMCDGGTVSVEIDHHERFELRNIMDMIDVDPESSRFFILVSGGRSNYDWVVATSQGTVHSG